MAILSYYPEMGEAKPERVQGNLQLSRGRGHSYWLETPLTLKGRGITFDEVIDGKNLTERGQYKAGWNRYRVTWRALQALQLKYDFAREALLD